uniref:hypothetical protein n=1 Tax=Rhodococcus qingshengii TaxID=334542 RepID=UPI001C4E0BA5|nr:hypothetical protein [Rhodococcus qingshengii]
MTTERTAIEMELTFLLKKRARMPATGSTEEVRLLEAGVKNFENKLGQLLSARLSVEQRSQFRKTTSPVAGAGYLEDSVDDLEGLIDQAMNSVVGDVKNREATNGQN